jgi:hypothetical protein
VQVLRRAVIGPAVVIVNERAGRGMTASKRARWGER